MTKFINNKRVCARGITVIDGKILFMERHRILKNESLHYYTIPGGGVEEDETFEKACLREIMEETNVKASIRCFLEKEEYETGIVYWYLTNYESGTPCLGGEELERNSVENHYNVVLIPIDNLDDLNILGEGKKIIKKALEILKEDNETL